MANFLPEKQTKDDSSKNESKLINLSLKDVEMEIDKFVQANTRELAKDKWLCPLSGKKFKGKTCHLKLLKSSKLCNKRCSLKLLNMYKEEDYL